MREDKTELLDMFDGEVRTYGEAPKKKVRKQKSIYGDQLICLTALFGLSVWQYGLRAFLIGIFSIMACMLSDALFCRMTKKTYNPKDLSTIATGLCISLMMPASVNYALVIGGAILAISVKHIFGGKDNYIFNPTCVAIAFLIICYPTDMLLYPEAGTSPAAFGDIGVNLVPGIESYLLKIGTAPTVSFLNMLIGNFAGPMGTTHFLVLAVCGVCLLCRRSLSLTVILFGLGSYCGLTALFPVYSGIGETLTLELIGGYLIFGFVFLAADPQTVPKTLSGKIAYGLIIGVLGCLFRHFGKVEGSFIFVILIANALSLRLDEICAAIGQSLKKAALYLHKDMGRYERLSRDARSDGEGKRISDTMEIIVPPTNYNMPPIDNKVTKINRKKTNIVTRYVSELKLKRKKDELIRKKQEKEANDYMKAMREMNKNASPKEQEGKPTSPKLKILHIIKQPKQKSQQKNNKQGTK